MYKTLPIVLLVANTSLATLGRDHLVRVEQSSIQWSFPPRIKQVHGNGICINHNCSVVATAYHLHKLIAKGTLEVVGGRTMKVLSPASEQDKNNTYVSAGETTVSYNVANDISFIYTKRPIPRKTGISYSYKCNVGQLVEVVGYYHNKFQSRTARAIGVNVPLEMGHAELNANLVLDIAVEPGTSGSAVLNEQGDLLGMVVLTGKMKLPGTESGVTVALPVRTIAAGLVNVDPVLGKAIFRDIPKEEVGGVRKPSLAYAEIDSPEDASEVIPELTATLREIPDAVDKLRAKAAAASELMVDIIAEQCTVQGARKPLCHELSMLDGQQAFREIKKDGTLGSTIRSFPIQKYGVWIQTDWGDTLAQIAENDWVFQGAVGEQYLFTSTASPKDDQCYYEEYSQSIPLFGGGHGDWKGPVSCVVEVLTDKNFNTSVVFTAMQPPSDPCRTELFQSAMYYDWVEFDGLKSPLLLPSTERVAAKIRGQKQLLYTTVSWSKYRKFGAEHRIRYPQTMLLRTRQKKAKEIKK